MATSYQVQLSEQTRRYFLRMHGDFSTTIHMQQFPQFLRTSTMYTAINNLHWTEFAALVLNPGLEPFLQEKPFITAHFPSSPAPGSNKDVDMISLPHLDYCHGAPLKTMGKRGALRELSCLQQLSTVPWLTEVTEFPGRQDCFLKKVSVEIRT